MTYLIDVSALLALHLAHLADAHGMKLVTLDEDINHLRLSLSQLYG